MVLKIYRFFKFPFFIIICSWVWNILKARENSAQNTGFHVYLNMYVWTCMFKHVFWKHRLRSKRQFTSSNMQQASLSELAAQCLHSGLCNAINNLNVLKSQWILFLLTEKASLPGVWGSTSPMPPPCSEEDTITEACVAGGKPAANRAQHPFLGTGPFCVSPSKTATMPSRSFQKTLGGSRRNKDEILYVEMFAPHAAHFSNEQPKICLVY